jgi:hypothetical protein
MAWSGVGLSQDDFMKKDEVNNSNKFFQLIYFITIKTNYFVGNSC